MERNFYIFFLLSYFLNEINIFKNIIIIINFLKKRFFPFFLINSNFKTLNNEKAKWQNKSEITSYLQINISIFIEEFSLSTNSKILCSKLSSRNNPYFLSGDDQNNINLWNFKNEIPQFVKISREF